MNIGRSEYTRLLKKEVEFNKAKKLLTRVKVYYEGMLLSLESEFGSGEVNLEKIKIRDTSDEVKILLEIEEFLKE